MQASLKIMNARLYDDATGRLSDIEVSDGRILAVSPAAAPPSGGGRGAMQHDGAMHRGGAVNWAQRNVQAIDAAGRTVIPGLIDVHVHGAGGGDVMDGTTDALAVMAQTLARLGTTSFLGTAFMLPDSRNEQLRLAAAHVGPLPGGAQLLGLHLEGPFVNPVRKGGLPPECLWPITPAAVDDVLAATGGALRMITFAPELDGGLDAVRRFTAAGVIVSIGHTDATCAEARAGIAAGISHATHLYNAMAPFHHREPGPLVAIHEADGVTVQLISDDVHVGRDAVRWTHRIFGGARCICTTDGIRTTGLADGRHAIGGAEYDSYDGVVRYADGRLIGTSLPLLHVALRFHEYTGCSFVEAIDTASANPARLLGLSDRKGRIAAGFDADLVVLDGEATAGRVWASVVAGAVIAPADAILQGTRIGADG
jgi:N-acetylglucosamine-6-phosphate deacetylase